MTIYIYVENSTLVIGEGTLTIDIVNVHTNIYIYIYKYMYAFAGSHISFMGLIFVQFLFLNSCL